MDGIDGKSLELDTSLTARKAEINSLNDLIEVQASSINNLKLAMNEAEQYSRRNCLKIYGVKESVSENTDEIICRLATGRCGVPMVTTDLDRSHRVAPRSNNASDSRAEGGNSRNNKPRAIIAKFCSYRIRNAVLYALAGNSRELA